MMKHIESGPRMSQAVAGGGVVALAGQVAPAIEGAAAQARAILGRIDDLLAKAGSDKSRILSATIWLKDMDDYDAFNAVWDAWIDPGRPPARACVKADLVRSEWLVEVQVLALIR